MKSTSTRLLAWLALLCTSVEGNDLAGGGTKEPAPNAPAPGSAQQPTIRSELATNRFRSSLSWTPWKGLHFEITQKTPLIAPREALGLDISSDVPRLHPEIIRFSTTINALFEVDAAAYRNSDEPEFDDGVGFRRARLKAQGDSILLLPLSFKAEVGFLNDTFTLDEARVSSSNLFPRVGTLNVGFFGPPMGLDLLTSTRDLTFMEPATPLQALAPGEEVGIQIGNTFLNKRATWALGIFAGGLLDTEYGNDSRDFGNLIGRVTYLPIADLHPDTPAENRLLHLGLSANIQYSASSNLRYHSRPESYLSEYVIDTGEIDAAASTAIGLEAAYVNGPVTLQAELIDSVVRQDDGELLNFYGFYASASWYLTGESRRYDPASAQFLRLIPKRNFDFGAGGWGAVEAAARVSYTDLSDRDVHGGRVGLLMGELNWYLHSHVRWMVNAGTGHVSGGAYDGSLAIFQTRLGIDF